jgi:hypothetical protein
MGYDVSYHPISEEEMHEWYFGRLDEIRRGELKTAYALAERFGLNGLYLDKYVDMLQAGASTAADKPFDKTHGFYVAVTQGFFRVYFYLRGSAFSFLLEKAPVFQTYTQPWADIVGMSFPNPAQNRIKENYSSGVFLPPAQLKNLLEDYGRAADVRETLDRFYARGHIGVFLKAARYAAENGLGLLEATEVVEPHPLELNRSVSYSNLFNCDTEGPLLYRETALHQLQAALGQSGEGGSGA